MPHKLANKQKPGTAKVSWSNGQTIIDNLLAVSHFKHETFDAFQYATDTVTTSKESLKRITKWVAKYFTHPSSYYPVPQTKMSFKDVRFITPLPPDELSEGRNRLWKIGWRTTVLCVREPWGARLLKARQELFLRQCIQMKILMPLLGPVFFPADQVEQTPTASSEMRSAGYFRYLRVELRKRCHSSTANPRVNCRFQSGGGVRERFG